MTNSPRLRWGIVALLCAATTINYIDRQTLSILSPLLRKELHLSEGDYASIVTAFLIPYTVMYALGGRMLDAIGVRIGLSLSLGWWSISTMLTAFARGAFSLGAFRFLLGIGEPCIFPAGVKVCGERFPPQLRATATGIFSSGSMIGAVVAPPLVAWITIQFGWRYAFFVPGVLGLIWLPVWWFIYRPLPSTAEATPPPDWRILIRQRTVWGLILPRFFSDPVWYFYLFWLPDYLQRERHLTLAEIGYYGWIPFLFADLGQVGGGLISDMLVRGGMTAPRARMMVLFAVGCLAPLGALAGFAPTAASAIAVTCLVAFLVQAWSTNTASLCADLIPTSATATVFGMMGMAGSLAGAMFAQVLGFVIQHFGYRSAFGLAAVLHPCAATILFFALRPVRISR
jgi:ACS family hexuronate transporter-like MFS transporter